MKAHRHMWPSMTSTSGRPQIFTAISWIAVWSPRTRTVWTWAGQTDPLYLHWQWQIPDWWMEEGIRWCPAKGWYFCRRQQMPWIRPLHFREILEMWPSIIRRRWMPIHMCLIQTLWDLMHWWKMERTITIRILWLVFSRSQAMTTTWPKDWHPHSHIWKIWCRRYFRICMVQIWHSSLAPTVSTVVIITVLLVPCGWAVVFSGMDHLFRCGQIWKSVTMVRQDMSWWSW